MKPCALSSLGSISFYRHYQRWNQRAARGGSVRAGALRVSSRAQCWPLRGLAMTSFDTLAELACAHEGPWPTLATSTPRWLRRLTCKPTSATCRASTRTVPTLAVGNAPLDGALSETRVFSLPHKPKSADCSTATIDPLASRAQSPADYTGTQTSEQRTKSQELGDQ